MKKTLHFLPAGLSYDNFEVRLRKKKNSKATASQKINFLFFESTLILYILYYYSFYITIFNTVIVSI